MKSSERYDLICVKIERAKQHIMNLQGEIFSFLAGDAYVISTKRDPQTRRLIYFVANARKTPPLLAAITGDVLQGLRSALDHLAYHLIIVGGGIPDRQTCFPITNTDDPAQYKANRTRKVKGMRQDAIDAIDATKPYKGGNDDLWRLHELNNIDKHRLLITVGAAYRDFDMTPVMMRLMNASNPFPDMVLKPGDFPPVFLRPKNRLCPLKAGDELFTDLPDAEVNNDIQFRFENSAQRAANH